MRGQRWHYCKLSQSLDNFRWVTSQIKSTVWSHTQTDCILLTLFRVRHLETSPEVQNLEQSFENIKPCETQCYKPYHFKLFHDNQWHHIKSTVKHFLLAMGFEPKLMSQWCVKILFLIQTICLKTFIAKKLHTGPVATEMSSKEDKFRKSTAWRTLQQVL